MRAVMTLVPTPSAVASIWALKTPAESRTNRSTRGSAIGPLGGRRGGPARPERIETVLALAQHRVALAGDEGPPQAPDGCLERVASRPEGRDVDGHVGHSEPARRLGERARRVDGTVVDEVLLEVAGEHERTFDVVGMRDRKSVV